MSEVATGVLHNVGNVLNSINISASIVAEHLNEFNIANIARAANLMREHAGDIGHFMANDPKGRQLPDYLAQLASHLSAEQSLLVKEIGFVKMKIEHVKEIVAAQQNYGKVVGLEERVKIEDLIQDVFRIHASELAQHEVQVRHDYPPGLPEILVDKHKVLQILLNLLSNAKHAVVDSGRKDKQVTVRVTNGDNRLRIAMTDNGVGIAPVNLRKIFNHGFTTRKSGGHGFGLHSGALAAKEMGGALHAQSEGPGQGATFILEIPLKPAEQLPDMNTPNPSLAPRILVIDDNVAIHEDFQKILGGQTASGSRLRPRGSGTVRRSGRKPPARCAFPARLRGPGTGGADAGGKVAVRRRSLFPGVCGHPHAARFGRRGNHRAHLADLSRPADRHLHRLLGLFVGRNHQPFRPYGQPDDSQEAV